MRNLLVIALAFLTIACSRGERAVNHADWLKESTRIWPGESKARVIAAAEAVVKHSDPGDISVEYNRSGFVARRKFFIYAVLATAEGEDRWTFSANENSEGASAALRVIQRGSTRSGNFSDRFRENQTFLGGFRLFYARIDYLLGRRTDWVACKDAAAKLALPQDAPGLNTLCSLTHQGADQPPPLRLVNATKAGKNLAKALPEPPQISATEDID
ncbi:MAG: hypothetical protein ACKVON_08450 [Beijerinckiaceae bacterium]